MIPKLIEVYEDNVTLNETIYTIPEFVALLKKTDELNAFVALWALYDPESPYFNVDEREREDKVKEDFPGKFYNLMEFSTAKEKCEFLYNSPARKLLRGAKAAIEKLSTYMEFTEIEHGKDGNINSVVAAIKAIPQLIQAYNVAEQTYKQELEKSRGQIQLGIDEDADDDDYKM